jgi:[Skp1-protein]-hydroxyproline N-acetylglucosaminyltransferase
MMAGSVNGKDSARKKKLFVANGANNNDGSGNGADTMLVNGRRRARGRTSNSRSGGVRRQFSLGAFLPLLLLIALLFYVLGFIQSIRSLPEFDPSEFTHLNPILGRAVLDYTRQFQNKMKGNEAPQLGNEGDGRTATLDNSHLRGKAPVALKAPVAIATPVYTGPFVPEAKWPVTIKDELSEEYHETIVHPGDNTKTMVVPRFWSPPLMKSTDTDVMSKETALKVVSYDTTKGKVHGTPDSRTIFIAIASYRDFECRETVDSIFKRARYPERVRVAVVDQLVKGEDTPCHVPLQPCDANPDQMACKWARQFDVYEMDAALAIGPVFARHVGHRLYRGEYYAMQIDAHVTFVTDWDVDIIEQQEATHNDMAVMSTYLTDVVGSIDPVTFTSKRKTRPIMCNTDYESGAQGAHLRHLSQPERRPPIADMPQMQPYWAAGWSFSRGHFVVNVPYDLYQPMIFQGEESSIGIRGFTYGYDHYAPQRSICFHTYAQGENQQKRGKVPHFWQNSNHYAGTGKVAMTRLLGIIGMIPEVDPSTWDHREEETYGCGSVRPRERFFTTFGIDVHKKRVEHHLCTFVQGGTMHKQFQAKLRPDGMGVDFSRIDYEFKDPNPKDSHQMLE